jgi:hypothetical protein
MVTLVPSAFPPPRAESATPARVGAPGPAVRHHAGMNDVPSPDQLRGAARACTVLSYAAGLAGIAAGTLLLREGDIAFAVILWVITFAVGAALMGVSVLVKAMAGLSARVEHISSDVRLLVGDRARAATSEPDRDPWLRHPPY